MSEQTQPISNYALFAKLMLFNKFYKEPPYELICTLMKDYMPFGTILARNLISKIPLEPFQNFLKFLNDTNESSIIIKILDFYEPDYKNPDILSEILVGANKLKNLELCINIFEKSDCLLTSEIYCETIENAFQILNPDYAMKIWSIFQKKCRDEQSEENYRILCSVIKGTSKLQLMTVALMYFNELQKSGKFMDSETALALLECCLKQGNYEQITEIFHYQKSISDKLDIACYCIILKGILKQGKIEPALNLFTEIQLKFDAKNEQPYAILIEGLAKNGRISQAVEFLNIADQKSLTISTCAYNAIIEGYAKNANMKDAWKIFDQMKSSKIPYDSYTYSAIFKGIKDDKSDLLKTLELLPELEKSGDFIPDAILYNVILDACVTCRMFEKAWELLERMELENSKVKPDEISYNTIIKGCGFNRCQKKAFDVIEMMRKRNIKPNAVTYNSLIDVCIRCGNMQTAWDVLAEMEKSGLTPDNFTYSTLIKGIYPKSYSNPKIGLEKAFELLAKIKSAGKVTPDEILYNCLMDVCVRFREPYRAVSLYNEMEISGITPSAITYGILIKAYGQAGELENAFNVFKKMKNLGFSPNAVTYGCLIDSCIKNNAPRKAENVYELMKNDNIKPNTIILTTLIKGYSKNKDLKSALQIYQKMLMDPATFPNNVTYNSLLDCCAKSNDIQMLETVFTEMKNNKIEPDLITYSTLIKGYCMGRKISNAVAMLNIMEKQGIQADEVLFNSLLDGCVKAGEFKIGIQVLEKMHADKIEPTDNTFSLLAKLYTKSGRTLQNIKNQEILSDIISALIFNENQHDAVDLYEKLSQNSTELKLNSNTFQELMKIYMKQQKYDKSVVIAINSLRLMPEGHKIDLIYDKLLKDATEYGYSVNSKDLKDFENLIIARKSNEKTENFTIKRSEKQIFRPIKDFNNYPQKPKYDHFTEKSQFYAKNDENINTRNIQKPGTVSKFAAFIEKNEEQKMPNENKNESKKSAENNSKFVAKTISFETGALCFRNSKKNTGKNENGGQGKIPRIV